MGHCEMKAKICRFYYIYFLLSAAIHIPTVLRASKYKNGCLETFLTNPKRMNLDSGPKRRCASVHGNCVSCCDFLMCTVCQFVCTTLRGSV